MKSSLDGYRQTTTLRIYTMIHPGCKIVSTHTTVGMTWNYHLSPLHSMYRNYQANKPMKSMMKTPYIEHMGLVGDRIANHRHNGCSITKNGHTVVKAMMYIVVLRQQSKLLKIQALLSLCKSISGPISSHGLFSHSNAKL